MMSILVFVAAIIVSYIVVKIGAAAFEITGLDPEQGHFQALSAFTGTGFTTRESELIVVHKQRRKIASALIILGNAGFVTLIATLANSMRPDNTQTTVFLPGLKQIPSAYIPYINLMIVMLILLVVHQVVTRSRLTKILMAKIQQEMIDKKLIKPASFEEFLLSAKGYGISQIEIGEGNPLLGKTLNESKLKEHDILVLSVERGEQHMLNPQPDTRFMDADKLICFGKLDNIRRLAYEEAAN